MGATDHISEELVMGLSIGDLTWRCPSTGVWLQYVRKMMGVSSGDSATTATGQVESVPPSGRWATNSTTALSPTTVEAAVSKRAGRSASQG